jgi:hypothetical protein
MSSLFQFVWTGPLFWTAALQSADRILGIPWWLWIAILLVLLLLIIAGLLNRGDQAYSYPAAQHHSPEEASDQLSSGTEFESAMNTAKSTTENQDPDAS